MILAAEDLGRRCFAMEVEPSYCDIALSMFEERTGIEATKVAYVQCNAWRP